MYYEVYIDVLFLSNFLMDYLLLLFLWKVLKCSTTHGWIFLGAVLGSFLTCMVIMLPIPFPILKLALFHVVVNTIMIKVGLKVKEKTLFWESFGMLYVGAFLLGGIMEHFRQYVRTGVLLLAGMVIGYYLMRGVWSFASHLQRRQSTACRVVLHTCAGEYELQALLDTGNGLKDTLSGKSVSVIDRSVANEILGEKDMETIRYVPYQSVGKSGVLPAVKIKKMCVYVEREYWVDAPLIGISEEHISTNNAYQIILNPDILGGK